MGLLRKEKDYTHGEMIKLPVEEEEAPEGLGIPETGIVRQDFQDLDPDDTVTFYTVTIKMSNGDALSYYFRTVEEERKFLNTHFGSQSNYFINLDDGFTRINPLQITTVQGRMDTCRRARLYRFFPDAPYALLPPSRN